MSRFGIWEDKIQNKTNKPAAADTNDFFFPALQGRIDIHWRHWSGAVITDDITTPANNAPAKDRDGTSRPQGQGYDIGSDEK